MAKGLSGLPASVQAVILAGFAALLAGAPFWYLVWPLSARREALQNEVKTVHEQNVRNRAFEAEHAAYLRRISEADEQLRLLRSIVPDQPSIGEFVDMVHEAEAGAVVHVRSFVAQPLVSESLYTEMPFKLRVDGTYYNVQDFFDRLAHGQRIVNVSELALGTPEGGGLGAYKVQAGETVGANCVVTTYFNRPASVPPPAPAKK